MKTLSAKSQALLFLVITFTLSWAQEFVIIRSPEGVNNSLLAFALMWTPGLVGLACSLAFGHRLCDIGFHLGSWRNYLLAYSIPVATSCLILFALIFTNQGSFELSPRLVEKAGGVYPALVRILVLAPILGTIMGSISGLGEEMGWRGFLHARLREWDVPHPYLLTGVIWGIWHWPLILFSNYATSASPWTSVILFTVTTISLSVFMGWMRERSGTVFTAALIYGSHNLWIQAIYPAFLKNGPLDDYFGGESGVWCALIYTTVAVFIYRRHLAAPQPSLSLKA